MPKTSRKTSASYATIADVAELGYITKGEVREIVDELLRSALRTQARDLERHLVDIDSRLRKLEE